MNDQLRYYYCYGYAVQGVPFLFDARNYACIDVCLYMSLSVCIHFVLYTYIANSKTKELQSSRIDSILGNNNKTNEKQEGVGGVGGGGLFIKYLSFRYECSSKIPKQHYYNYHLVPMLFID